MAPRRSDRRRAGEFPLWTPTMPVPTVAAFAAHRGGPAAGRTASESGASGQSAGCGFGLLAALAILAFLIALVGLTRGPGTPRPDGGTAYAEAYGIPDSLAVLIASIAEQEGIDTRLAFGLVQVESSFRPRAVSSVGAIGLAQVMPATAAMLQPGIDAERLYEPRVNLRLGFRYLRRLLDRYDDLTEALLAYNLGPGTLARLRADGRSPGTDYPNRVLRAAARAGGGGR